jgi:hypothetical protein
MSSRVMAGVIQTSQYEVVENDDLTEHQHIIRHKERQETVDVAPRAKKRLEIEGYRDGVYSAGQF